MSDLKSFQGVARVHNLKVYECVALNTIVVLNKSRTVEKLTVKPKQFVVTDGLMLKVGLRGKWCVVSDYLSLGSFYIKHEGTYHEDIPVRSYKRIQELDSRKLFHGLDLDNEGVSAGEITNSPYLNEMTPSRLRDFKEDPNEPNPTYSDSVDLKTVKKFKLRAKKRIRDLMEPQVKTTYKYEGKLPSDAEKVKLDANWKVAKKGIRRPMYLVPLMSEPVFTLEPMVNEKTTPAVARKIIVGDELTLAPQGGQILSQGESLVVEALRILGDSLPE